MDVSTSPFSLFWRFGVGWRLKAWPYDRRWCWTLTIDSATGNPDNFEWHIWRSANSTIFNIPCRRKHIQLSYWLPPWAVPRGKA